MTHPTALSGAAHPKPSLPALPGLIFDLDGTLVDSLLDLNAALEAAFARLGKSFSLDETRSFVGSGAPVLVQRAMAARGLSGEGLQRDLLAAFLAHYKANPVARTRIYPGVIEALTLLRNRGHAMAICTNKPIAPAQSLLRALGLAPFFAVVIGGDSLDRRKPDPMPALACHGALGSGQSLFIGDSEVDAETALAAGMPCLLHAGGFRKAELQDIPHVASFEDFADLPGLVAQISAAL